MDQNIYIYILNKIYKNANIIFFSETFYAPENLVSTNDGKGIIILGQDADSLGGGFDENQAFSGSISEFHMWDRAITEKEVKQISNCDMSGQSLKGNIINWSRINTWEKHNVSIREVENFCKDLITPKFIIFNQRMNFGETKRSCHILGGTYPYEFTIENRLRYYQNILKLFEDAVVTEKSPCISQNGETNYAKFWIGFKIEGLIFISVF